MTTLTRSTSRTTPAYKDYVNFLGAYKNGKKEENYPLSNSSSLDQTDFSQNSAVPFNTFLENSKNKKFNTVKLAEKPQMKSEIFIEIKPANHVHEVSKMFETSPKSPSAAKTVNSKINIFERQLSKENKPKLAQKPILTQHKIEIKPPTPPPQVPPPTKEFIPPPPPAKETIIQSSPSHINIPPPPPPPPMMNPAPKKFTVPVKAPVTSQPVPKLQATLTKGPQVKHTVNNPNGVVSNGIDRNDPMLKKLVYGTLRGLYGAYHEKANDMMATLPRDRVKKSNGVQDIIEKIASNGDLDKLNGRVNPKSDQE